MKKPELLAPAGDIEILKSAIQAGADAVYCSGKSFGARAFARNFTEEEIIEASKYVHLRNKLIYITVNTIIFDEELGEVTKYIDFLYQYVDGIIVQDLGLFHYIRKTYPDFNVHISTQQNIHCLTDAKFLKKLGSKRIVLARETPMSIIKEIVDDGIEVEVFVHGALCFAYSGNCYFSKEIGGRSGNRGTCAQPCRKKYSLLIDNEEKVTNMPLLSMKDLYTLEDIPHLCNIGISSFKIEGRMKSAAYVVQVVKAYRMAIDNWYNNLPLTNISELYQNLQVAFNREYTKGYLLNALNNEVVNLKSVNHQGIRLGIVTKTNHNQTTIKLENKLNLQDAIRFKEKEEWGMVITKIILNNNSVKNANPLEEVTIYTPKKVKVGTIVLKTKSNILEDEALLIKQKELVLNPLELRIKIDKNKIECILLDKSLNSSFCVIKDNLELLKTNKSSKEEIELLNLRIKEQFSKINKLPIQYQKVIFNNDDNLFVPIPLINQIRTDLLNKWQIAKENNKIRNYIPYLIKPSKQNLNYNDKIIILNHANKKIDLENNQQQINHYNFRINFNHQTSNYDLIEHLSDLECGKMISPYLNVANHLSIEFIRCFNQNTIFLSVELDEEHLKKLLKYDSNLGILAYSKFPIMVSNHCVIGNYYNRHDNNCLNCKLHQYYLKDEFQNNYQILPLGPKYNCQMLIFNKSRKRINFKNCHLLFEFYDESVEEINEIIKNI